MSGRAVLGARYRRGVALVICVSLASLLGHSMDAPRAAGAATGSALSWGDNGNGELGNGSLTNSLTPTAVTMPSGVSFVTVSGGWSHVLALDSAGSVWAWGSNAEGAIGNGSTTDATTPVAVSMPASVTFSEIAAGNSFSLALDTAGRAWAWGRNDEGELGDGYAVRYATAPVAVSMPAGVTFKAIAAGELTAFAIDTSGAAWSWGENVACCGGNVGSPTAVAMPSGVAFQSLAGQEFGALAIDTSGAGWAWGSNTYGQLGNGTTIDSAVPVAMTMPSGVSFTHVAGGFDMGVALDTSGKAWAWGINSVGQLGNATTTESLVPVPVSMPSGATFSQIAAAGDHAVGLDAIGRVWSWGFNNFGQLGNGTTTSSTIPVQVSSPSGMAFAGIGAGLWFGIGLTGGGTSPSPTVSGVSPSEGSVAGGALVAVFGTNLTTATSVTFGGVPALFVTFGSAIIAIAPRVAGLGAVDVVVNGPGGSSPTGSADKFTYWPAFGKISATLGTPYQASVATVTLPTGPYSGTLSWGDGSVTPATVSQSTAGTYSVIPTPPHTYWSVGPQNVTITVTNSASHAISKFFGTATVHSNYVAMGDSYSSGEGADWQSFGPQFAGCNYFAYSDKASYDGPTLTDNVPGSYISLGDGQTCVSGKVDNGTNVCHRSIAAYPHILDGMLTGLRARLHFVACSGDTIDDVYQQNQTGKENGEKPQLQAVANFGTSTSLVTMTFVGDDLGFAGIVADCVSPFKSAIDCIGHDPAALQQLGYDPSTGKPSGLAASSGLTPVRNFSANNLQLSVMLTKSQKILHDRIVVLLRAIQVLAPAARIMITGYPRWFPGTPITPNDEHFSPGEQKWLDDRIDMLDRVIHDAAEESGVAQYVDVSNAFDSTHYLQNNTQPVPVSPSGVANCSGIGAYLNGLDLASAAAEGDLKVEAMHPNPCGHVAFANAFDSAYTSGNASASFTIRTGQTFSRQIQVTSGNQRWLTVTARGSGGTLVGTLTSPTATVCPITLPSANIASFSTFAVWTVDTHAGPCQLHAGTWTLQITNITTNDSGTTSGTVTIAQPDVLPILPAASTLQIVSYHTGAVCKATFRAISPSPSQVNQYTWYDAQGVQQTDVTTSTSTDDTMTMSSARNNFQGVLQTTGKNGNNTWQTFTGIKVC